MAKVTGSDKIAKLANQRESLKKQIEDSQQKIHQYETKLVHELGQIALAHYLDRLTQAQLKTAFGKIAKEHNLS